MKHLLIILVILFSTPAYSQPERYFHYETFCELEIFDWNEGGWVKLSPDICYEFLMNNEQNIFVIQNLSDSSDFVFYKIYETQNKLFNWKYKSRNEITKEDIYLNYTKDGYYNMLRVDFPKFSVRYKDKVK